MPGNGLRTAALRRLRPRPVLRGALRLLRLRDLDRPDAPRRRLRRRVRARPRVARCGRRRPRRDQCVLRWRHAVVASRRPRRAHPRRDPADPRRRGHRRVQPGLRRRVEAGGLPRRRCHARLLRCAVDAGSRARGPRPDARSGERRAGRGRGPGRRLRDLQPGPDLRRRTARRSTTGARRWTPCSTSTHRT